MGRVNLRSIASSRQLRWLGLILAAALVVAVGMAVGWRLAGPAESETELGRVTIEVAPDLTGRIDAFVPIADWGIRANSFDGPFELRLEVRTVDRRGALAAASDGGGALQDLEDELEGAARSAVLRAFAWGLGVSLALALLLWFAVRSQAILRPLPYIAAALAVLGGAGTVALAAISFDSKSFSKPTFYGRGEELAQLLAFFERGGGTGQYSSNFEGTLANFTAYLSDAPRTEAEGDRTFLLGSDLHNNAPILSALQRFGGDEPVMLVGDFAHEGNEAEARLIVPRLAALGSRVFAVSGNHDSQGLMEDLAEAGVTVLEQEGRLQGDGTVTGPPLVEVNGLTIAGFADPLEWQGDDPGTPERSFSFPELDDGEAVEEAAKAELVSWFGSLPEEPDAVLVHQNVLAQHLAATLFEEGYDRPLTILTGHNHLQGVDRYGSILVINAGTLGAGGVLGAGQDFAGLGLVHPAGDGAEVASVDLIRIEPLSGQAQADRAVIDIVCPPEESLEEPCHYEP